MRVVPSLPPENLAVVRRPARACKPTIRMSQDLVDRLDAIAAAARVNRNALVVELLEAYTEIAEPLAESATAAGVPRTRLLVDLVHAHAQARRPLPLASEEPLISA